jgi:uncharacterized membrane protein YsdA (DUF1294 family)
MIALQDSGIWAGAVLVVNGCVFLLYMADKGRAAAGRWRIPERVLLCSAIAGPFGAFLAMQAFRHKTQKLRFLLVPLACLLQILLFAWLAAGS